MENEQYQRELFEFDKPKKKLPLFGNIFAKNGEFFERKSSVTLAMEHIIFIAIAVIMMMVIVYAVGVENGKAVSAKMSSRPVVTPAQNKPTKPAVTTTAYAIVVGTFSNKATAESIARSLKKSGFDASVYLNNAYFQVRVGTYETKEKAMPYLARIKRLYKDAYLKQK